MKQKDIILIVVVVIISGIISVVLSKIIITAPKNRQTKVEVVEKISSDFPKPDPKFFNKDANDPTKLIQIGDTPNPTPFQ